MGRRKRLQEGEFLEGLDDRHDRIEIEREGGAGDGRAIGRSVFTDAAQSDDEF